MTSSVSVDESSRGADLMRALFETRELSERIAQPLSLEDRTVQAMPDASPTKWHLAHTTWFFETFILTRYLSGYQLFDERFGYCFNSYYEAEGPRHPRPERGLLSRPSCSEVDDYRRHVDEGLRLLVKSGLVQDDARLFELLSIGVHHEQQHQELMLTDILALFARSPFRPSYAAQTSETWVEPDSAPHAESLLSIQGGVYEVGSDGSTFCWDNEQPRHKALLHPFRICDRLVTNAAWLEFMQDGGYRTPTLWLSDGWAAAQRENWTAPAYFENREDRWLQMTLSGLQPIDPNAPVAHISFFEADAFARWAGRRLPTEFEWEVASRFADPACNDLGSWRLAPRRAAKGDGLLQMYGDVWEWTASAYLPYPGYRQPDGAIGEYNGKFMSGQMILRGGSCVTPSGHIRAAYRNFFQPHQRWQFCGLRLAEDA